MSQHEEPGVGFGGAPARWSTPTEPVAPNEQDEQFDIPTPEAVQVEITNETPLAMAQGAAGEVAAAGRQQPVDGPPARRPAERPDALTPERLLIRRTQAPERGWRRAAYKATGGRWNPGDAPEVVERRRLEAEATARMTVRTRFVPVLTRKGGVGKTTAAMLLAKTLAQLREDRIVALDANPDRGTLADRAPRQTSATVWDVVESAHAVGSFADMSRLVSRDVTRLDVIASETDARRARAFGAEDYKRVAELLQTYYAMVVTDCGTDFTHDVIPAILGYADAVVVVAGASVDEARLASETLDMLGALGYQHLADSAVVVVQSATDSPVNLREVTAHFASRARAVVQIPRDPHLAEGSIIELDRLLPATRRAALQLASLVVSDVRDDTSSPTAR